MQLGTSLSSRRASDAITEIEIRIEPRLVLGYLLTTIRIVPVQDKERKKNMARESVFSSLHGELSTRKSAPKVNRPWLAFIFASDFYRLLYFWRNLFFSRFFHDDEARRSAVDGADFREKSDQRSPSEVKRMNIYRARCIKPVLCMYRKRNCFLRDRQPLPGNSFDFHDCRTLPFPRCFFVRKRDKCFAAKEPAAACRSRSVRKNSSTVQGWTLTNAVVPDNAVINRDANYREGIHHAVRWENNESVNSRENKTTRIPGK